MSAKTLEVWNIGKRWYVGIDTSPHGRKPLFEIGSYVKEPKLLAEALVDVLVEASLVASRGGGDINALNEAFSALAEAAE